MYLLDYFHQICQSSDTPLERSKLDLVDINGDIKNLRHKEVKNEFASKILNAKSVFILVSVTESDLADFPDVVPLVTDSDVLTPKFLARIANITTPLNEKRSRDRVTKKSKKPTSTSSKKSTNSFE